MTTRWFPCGKTTLIYRSAGGSLVTANCHKSVSQTFNSARTLATKGNCAFLHINGHHNKNPTPLSPIRAQRQTRYTLSWLVEFDDKAPLLRIGQQRLPTFRLTIPWWVFRWVSFVSIDEQEERETAYTELHLGVGQAEAAFATAWLIRQNPVRSHRKWVSLHVLSPTSETPGF